MNLPLINTDNINNSYFGWKTNNIDFAPDSVGATDTQIANWINSFLGAGTAFVGTPAPFQQPIFNLIFPVSFESLSRPATANKGRFFSSLINTTNSNPDTLNNFASYAGQGGVGGFSFPGYLGNSNRVYFAVLNTHSFNFFATQRDNPAQSVFFSCGWLQNSLYSGSAFVRSAYYLFLDSIENSRGAGRPISENSGRQNFVVTNATTVNPIVNYPVSCQTATPGANTTELYLRDDVAPNKAVGYVPNVLKSSLNIPIGQIYRNSGIDPDNSNMNTWQCVGHMGGESILMRVWTQGLG